MAHAHLACKPPSAHMTYARRGRPPEAPVELTGTWLLPSDKNPFVLVDGLHNMTGWGSRPCLDSSLLAHLPTDASIASNQISVASLRCQQSMHLMRL